MKKKLKNIYLLVACILTLSISTSLIGCSGKKGDETSDEKKVVKIFIPGYEDELWKGLYDVSINDFEAENPDVDVEVIPAGWDEANTKLIALIQAKEAPDVIISGSRSLKQFADMGAIEPLDSYMTDSFKEGRVETVLNTANINGVQYGIPLAFSSRALYYRSDLIEKAPETWEELLATAEKVSKENEGVYGFAIPTDITSGTDELFNFIYQNGGSATDENGNIKLATTENIETLEFLKSFNDKGIIPDPVGTTRSGQAQMFQNGDLAMFISGPWDKDTLEASKDTAPYSLALLPKGTKMAETLVTDSFSMSSQSENKELAWKLIEYMGKYEYQNAYDEAIGFFPILKEEENEERYNTEFLKPFKEMIQYGVAEPQVPVWDTFNSEFIKAVQKVMTGAATAEEALKAAEEELTK